MSGHVLEHGDRERERQHERGQRPHRRRDRQRAAERQREMPVHAEVDDRRPHAGDAQRGGERPALEAHRRQRVGGADQRARRPPRRSRAAPWVRREHERQRGGDERRSARPPRGVSSPAAIGRCGLLTRSISTSVIWLMPTIARFTPAPATITQNSWSRPEPGSSWTAIRYRPVALTNVPISVCGREKRHSTRERAGRRRTAAAWLLTGAPSARAASSPARSARTRGRRASRRRSAPPRARGRAGRAARARPRRAGRARAATARAAA